MIAIPRIPAWWCFGALLVGVLLGFAIREGYGNSGESTFTLEPDVRPPVPVVRVDNLRDGVLSGTIGSGARLFIGNTPIVAGSGGTFRAPLPRTINASAVSGAPEGMIFIASRRGKKYYIVGSPEGDRLVPENRIYFRTAADAEAAGYRR